MLFLKPQSPKDLWENDVDAAKKLYVKKKVA